MVVGPVRGLDVPVVLAAVVPSLTQTVGPVPHRKDLQVEPQSDRELQPVAAEGPEPQVATAVLTVVVAVLAWRTQSRAPVLREAAVAVVVVTTPLVLVVLAAAALVGHRFKVLELLEPQIQVVVAAVVAVVVVTARMVVVALLSFVI